MGDRYTRKFVTERERILEHLQLRYGHPRPDGVRESCLERNEWIKNNFIVSFHPKVKTGNWIDEQADVEFIKNQRKLINDYDGAYKSDYQLNYDKTEEQPKDFERVVRIYPKHQPELDPPALKAECNKYESTYSAAYNDFPVFPGMTECKNNHGNDHLFWTPNFK